MSASTLVDVRVRVLSFNIWEDARLGLSRVIMAVRRHFAASLTGAPPAVVPSVATIAATPAATTAALTFVDADCWIISFQEISRESLTSVAGQLGLDATKHTHWQPCRRDVRRPDWGLGVIASLPLHSCCDTSSLPLLSLLPGPYAANSDVDEAKKTANTDNATTTNTTNSATNGWPSRWLNGHSVHLSLPNGRLLRIVNCHLHYKPYGPYLVMDGIKAARQAATPLTLADEHKLAASAIAESDHTQGADMAAIAYQLLNAPSPLPSASSSSSVPITLIMGDFNLCSHLDWIGSVATTTSDAKVSADNKSSADISALVCSPPRDYGLHCPVAWPVSTQLHSHGFEDAYRVVHDDARQAPGYTWPALSEKEMGFPALDDRIDFIYIRPSTTTPTATTTTSTTANVSSSTASVDSTPVTRLARDNIRITGARRVGADETDWPIDDIRAWPSDHYAVSIALRL